MSDETKPAPDYKKLKKVARASDFSNFSDERLDRIASAVAPRSMFDGREPIPLRRIVFRKDHTQNVPGKSGAASSVTRPAQIEGVMVWWELWFLPAIRSFSITSHDPRRGSDETLFVPEWTVAQWEVLP